MGKPGKKAGKGILPPTNVNRKVDSQRSDLRDQRTIRRLKMYNSKIKRDSKGNIVKGSVLQASDRIEQGAARIAPDRRWFGNTRVIGQEALQEFRKKMNAVYRDPYSVVIRQSKLPLSMLQEPKQESGGLVRQEMRWEKTFGTKANRKRVRLDSFDLNQLANEANEKGVVYAKDKVGNDRDLLKESEEERADRTQNRTLFAKGQSSRIWNELYKVIDSSDVVLYVLDARDPIGTRSAFIETYMRREKKYKHFVFVLNKCDLIPMWATARWLQVLSKEYPTIAFHASVNHPFGKGNVISLLRQFSRLHNVTHRGSKRTKTPISVGIIGYPNVGKSSLINTLRRKKVCKVAPIPGETKVWQYIALTRSIFLVDCPGVIYDREGNNDVQAILKGVVRVERLGSADKTDAVSAVLEAVKPKDIAATYNILQWVDTNDFLEKLATLRGKLMNGGVPDSEAAARMVLYDWQRGKVPWFVPPPFASEKHLQEAVTASGASHMKSIERYGAPKLSDTPPDEETDESEMEASDNQGDGVPEFAGREDPEATVATFVAAQEELKRKRMRKEKRNVIAKKNAMLAKDVQEDELWSQFLAAAGH